MRLRVFASIMFAVMLGLPAMPLWAQSTPPANSQQGPAHNPWAHLDKALQLAGAPALSQDQQDKLNELLTQYRAAHPCGAANPTLQSALRTLESAILSKDQATVNSTAAIIAAQVSKLVNDKIQSAGTLAIQALSILTDEQVTALRTQYGDMGLLRMFHGALRSGCGHSWGYGSMGGHQW